MIAPQIINGGKSGAVVGEAIPQGSSRIRLDPWALVTR